jgi:hypothetical protein
MKLENSNETFFSKLLHSVWLLPFTVLCLVVVCGNVVVSAAPLTEAELFFELNDTDGDLGIHASIDGGPYVLLEIKDPNGTKIYTVKATGNLNKQGLTQLFFESAEPSFDALAPQAFFNRFPEGTYQITARTRKGKVLREQVDLSHVLAAPVDNVTVNGRDVAEDCDANNLPRVNEPVVVDWDPVTESHPDLGNTGPVEIVLYQFFVEQEDLKFSADLIPNDTDVTRFKVPPEFFRHADKSQPIKFEIIARTSTGNNTAIENCFIVTP